MSLTKLFLAMTEKQLIFFYSALPIVSVHHFLNSFAMRRPARTTLQRHYTENSKQIFQKLNWAASFPIPTLIFRMFRWAICIFPRLVCLFCWRKIGGPIMGIYRVAAINPEFYNHFSTSPRDSPWASPALYYLPPTRIDLSSKHKMCISSPLTTSFFLLFLDIVYLLRQRPPGPAGVPGDELLQVGTQDVHLAVPVPLVHFCGRKNVSAGSPEVIN